MPSPIRLMSREELRPPAIAPTPWTDTITPTKLAGRPNASTMAKTADSMKPITSSAIPVASTVGRKIESAKR